MTPDGSRQNGMGGMTQSDACAQTKKRADDLLWGVSLPAHFILLNSVQMSQTLSITLDLF